MNMKQIEGFCLLAKTLNFSRAASRMYISQPAFSRMIVSLEEELGCQLFLRSKTEPKLTVAGEQIYRSMLEMLRHYQDIRGLSLLAAENKAGIIRIGTLDDGLDEIARSVFRAFRKEYPGVALEFRTYSEAEIFRALEIELIDVAVTSHYPPAWQQGTEAVALRSNRECAVFSKAHPLAERERITVTELAEEPFIMMEKTKSQMGYARITSLCLANGFIPKVVMEADSIANALTAVDCGMGCTILTERFAGIGGKNVVFVPLDGGQDHFDWMIWKSDTPNMQVKNLQKTTTLARR